MPNEQRLIRVDYETVAHAEVILNHDANDLSANDETALRSIVEAWDEGITEGEAYDATNPDLAHSSTGKFCQERVRAAFSETKPSDQERSNG